MRVLCVVGRPLAVHGQRVLDPACAPGRRAGARRRRRRPTTPATTACAAQRAHVAGHVGRAAEVEGLRRDLDHGHRRLGRDARHAAPQELVEHHVADHEARAGRASARSRRCARARAEGLHAAATAGARAGGAGRRAGPDSRSANMRISESPKLYSNRPGGHERGQEARRRPRPPSARSAARAAARARRRPWPPPPTTATRRGRAGRARRRSAARCRGGGAPGVGRVRPAVVGVDGQDHAPGPCPNTGFSRIMSMPACHM